MLIPFSESPGPEHHRKWNMFDNCSDRWKWDGRRHWSPPSSYKVSSCLHRWFCYKQTGFLLQAQGCESRKTQRYESEPKDERLVQAMPPISYKPCYHKWILLENYPY